MAREFEIRVSKVVRSTAFFRVWAEDKAEARQLFAAKKAQRIRLDRKDVEKPTMRVRKV
jgi:hypothetical protein